MLAGLASGGGDQGGGLDVPQMFGGLGDQKAITNAWGFEVNQADILSAFNELDPNSTKRIVYTQFVQGVKQLKLKWDDNTCKAVWTELDENKKKYLNLETFQSGLRSTDPRIQEFYQTLMSANDFNPEYNDYGNAPAKPNERLKWLRNFAKKARNFEKVDANDDEFDWREVTNEIRLVCRCITTPKFIAEDKKFSAFSMWTQFGKHYLNSTRGLIARDMCIFYARVAQKVPEAFYKAPARVFDALSYWINMKGSYSTEYAFATLKVAMINAPNNSKALHAIVNGISDIILKEHSQMTANWLQRWLFLLNVWCDSHAMRKFDADIWSRIGAVCEVGVNHKDESVRHDGLQLLSRMDVHAHNDAKKILQKLTSQTRKRYKRDYGPAKIAKYLDNVNATSTAEEAKTNDAQAASPRTKKVRQKAKIGAIGTTYVQNKVQNQGKVGGKQRIADITNYDDLLNPYEFPITKLDIEMGFRYADLNSDGTISSKDFVLSLAKVGIEKTDVVAKEYFSYLSPKLKPLKLNAFEKRLEEYSEDFQPWFCRIISGNHLLRQPYATDKPIRQLKKILKDTRKLIWRQKIEAMYALCRGLARQVTSSDQFKIKFQPMCKFWCAAIKDTHPLVSRAATVALTKMTWYQKGGFTKFLKPILDAICDNLKKESVIHAESSFGLFANIIKHVPDTKTFIQLQTLKQLVTAKQVSLQKYGWRLLNVQLERIVGLDKKRPDQWWSMLDTMLEHGTNIKKNEVAEIAIITFLILESSKFKKETVYKYRKNYPKTKKNLEDIRSEFFSEVEKHIQEYKDEAKQAHEGLDMFSLLSETTDEDKDDQQSEPESAGEVDEYADMPITLHSINVESIQNTYDMFNIKETYNQVQTVHAALRYLGCDPTRDDITLLMAEINNTCNNEPWTPEIFAVFAKHAYGTVARGWASYYESVRIAADILEVNQQVTEDIPFMNDPAAYLQERVDKISHLQSTNSQDAFTKCNLIASLYAPFAAPEVENDAMLFEKLMEAVNPIFFNELKTGNLSIVVSEVCICLSRIVQYHVGRFESFGEQYYEYLFRLMANGTSVIFHACSQATFIIGKLVDFLSEENALKMTQQLLACMKFSSVDRYFQEVIKTLVASVMVNVPIEKQEEDNSKILKMWDASKQVVYDGVLNDNVDVVNYCATCLAYLYQIDYLDFKKLDNKDLPAHVTQQIEEIAKNAAWESLFDVKLENESNIITEYGWTELSKEELLERKELLIKWHELEQKSNNAIGMASVMQLLKTVARATKDTNRSEKRAYARASQVGAQLGGNEDTGGTGGNALTLENLNRLQQTFGSDKSEDDTKSV